MYITRLVITHYLSFLSDHQWCNMADSKMKILIVFLSVIILHVVVVSSQSCSHITSCSCQGSKGLIDLSPLALTGGEPRFKDIEDTNGGYLYSWNPCEPFSEGSCINVSGCKTDNSSFYAIGKPETAQFKDDPSNGLMITYTAHKDIQRSLSVILRCVPSLEGELNVTGEVPVGSSNYVMTLFSKHACYEADLTTSLTTQPSDETSPESGSTVPQSGSTEPQSGSTEPQSGSTVPQTGSTVPQSGSTKPQSRSTTPVAPESTTMSAATSSHLTGVISVIVFIVVYVTS